MRMVPDKTGRFAERPHYPPEELDWECEQLVSTFLRKKRGDVEFPILTEDLHVLIEQADASLDFLRGPFGVSGDDVEGMTEFFSIGPPRYRSPKGWRTTNVGKIGYGQRFPTNLVMFISIDTFGPKSFFRADCLREKVLKIRPSASGYDFKCDPIRLDGMAGRIHQRLSADASNSRRRFVAEYSQPRGLHATIYQGSEHGRALIAGVVERFAVSEEAARICRLKLNLLASSNKQPSLFG